MSSYKTIHHEHHHVGWDNSLVPVLEIEPGAELELLQIESGLGGVVSARLPVLLLGKVGGSKVGDQGEIRIHRARRRWPRGRAGAGAGSRLGSRSLVSGQGGFDVVVRRRRLLAWLG